MKYKNTDHQGKKEWTEAILTRPQKDEYEKMDVEGLQTSGTSLNGSGLDYTCQIQQADLNNIFEWSFNGLR